MPAVVWLWGPPCSPGKIALSIAVACSAVSVDRAACCAGDAVACSARDADFSLCGATACNGSYCAGHAKRAGLIAAANSYMGRLVVVVDDDVDPSDLAAATWAWSNDRPAGAPRFRQ